MQQNNKYYNEGLEYYLFLGLGTKKDFENNIIEYGTDYFKYYYNESYEDSSYQAYIGNVSYPSSI